VQRHAFLIKEAGKNYGKKDQEKSSQESSQENQEMRLLQIKESVESNSTLFLV